MVSHFTLLSRRPDRPGITIVEIENAVGCGGSTRRIQRSLVADRTAVLIVAARGRSIGNIFGSPGVALQFIGLRVPR